MRSARSRGSTLQLVTSNPDLLSPNGTSAMPPRRRQRAFLSHLAHWKHWFLESARRARSPNTKNNTSTPNLLSKSENSSRAGPKEPSPRPEATKATTNRPLANHGSTLAPSPRINTTPSKRTSLSPSPLTPRSAFRRPSSGLRGRKSTSSSVSSIRSVHHHHHSHSKASSTSSNGSDVAKVALVTRSPHHSVKVLPATPTTGSFPSNIRVVRQAPISSFNESINWARESSPGGLVFAKRKRNIFKGPVVNGAGLSPNGGVPGNAGKTGGHSRSASLAGRRSGEIIEEEDEDEIEEVDAFTPLTGPEMEEHIYSAEERPVSPRG